jgi:hypothetical protein
MRREQGIWREFKRFCFVSLCVIFWQMDAFDRWMIGYGFGYVISAIIGSLMVIASTRAERIEQRTGFTAGRLSRLPFALVVVGITLIERWITATAAAILLYLGLEIVKWIAIIKREHDRNFNATHSLYALIPLYPVLLFFSPGSSTQNRFGEAKVQNRNRMREAKNWFNSTRMDS